MHELGIVFSIMDTVEMVAQQQDIHHIQSITLTLGEVSGIVPSFLDDCFMWARKKHPILQDATLKFEIHPAVTLCQSCQKTYATVSHGRICPHCGSDKTVLLEGNETEIKEIEAL